MKEDNDNTISCKKFKDNYKNGYGLLKNCSNSFSTIFLCTEHDYLAIFFVSF